MKKWISFFEIPSRDYRRAVTFYSEVFGQKLEDCDFGTTRMAFFPADEGGCYGAVIACEGYQPGSDGLIVSFNVEEGIDPVLERVRKAGGQVTVPRCEVGGEGKGYFALFSDCEGNRIGLHSNR